MTKGQAPRSERLTVRLTAAEREVLLQRATKRGLSAAAYVRRAALRASPGGSRRQTVDTALHQLSRIGNRLEHLADHSEEKELWNTLRELRQVMAALHSWASETHP